jgi:uncharacterized membrane protein HdeD (DUF308 family)
MTRSEDTLRGIIAIIVGIFVIAILFTKNFTANESLGIGTAFLGLWMLILSFDIKNFNKIESTLYFILFLVSIITGVFLYFNITLSGITLNMWINITGILILISGIIALTGKETIEKGTGITGMILGIVFLILNYYSYNLLYSAIFLGIWLMIIGIIQFFISYDKEYEYGFYKLF